MRAARYKHKIFVTEDGKVQISDLETYKQNCLSMRGKKGYLTLQESSRETSLDHYAYYFGVVVKAALESNEYGGWTKQDFNDYMEERLLTTIVRRTTGAGKAVIIRHTERIEQLGSKRFSLFIEEVKDILAAESNIIIKDRKNYE